MRGAYQLPEHDHGPRQADEDGVQHKQQRGVFAVGVAREQSQRNQTQVFLLEGGIMKPAAKLRAWKEQVRKPVALPASLEKQVQRSFNEETALQRTDCGGQQ